jgi:hypothetical protein
VETEERHALTNFCIELDGLREECAFLSENRRHLLERIEAEARARRPIVALLAELLNASREGTTRTLAEGLPGVGPGQADEERFRCPDGACDRVGGTTPAGPVPRCRVTGQPMKRR